MSMRIIHANDMCLAPPRPATSLVRDVPRFLHSKQVSFYQILVELSTRGSAFRASRHLGLVKMVASFFKLTTLSSGWLLGVLLVAGGMQDSNSKASWDIKMVVQEFRGFNLI